MTREQTLTTTEQSKSILAHVRELAHASSESGWGYSGGWLPLETGEYLFVAAYANANMDTIYTVGPLWYDYRADERYTDTDYATAERRLSDALVVAGNSAFLPEVR